MTKKNELKTEIKKELKNELRAIGTRSQCHGVPRIITRKHVIRLVWLVFFVTSLGLCVATMVQNANEYLTFGVNTLVRVVALDSLPLPAITVCNMNPLVTRSAAEYIVDYYARTYNVTLRTYTQFAELVASGRVPDEIQWLVYRTYDPAFDQTRRASFGYTMREQTVWCRERFSTCDDLDNKVRSIYHPKYGNCFVFNSGVQNNGSMYGLVKVKAEEYGLEMGIFAGVSDSLVPYFYQKSVNGIVLIVDDQDSISLEKEGILVKPGTFANIALSLSTSSNQPQPYNDCVERGTAKTRLANEMRRLNMTYDYSNCFTLCRQMTIIDRLGCYDMRYPALFGARPCDTKQSFEMLLNTSLDLNKCQAQCPFECDTSIYDWDISYATFPNYNSFKIINATHFDTLGDFFPNRSYSYTDLQQSVAGFFIYFDPLSVKRVSQTPSMPIQDLIANIGGILGVFLGVSILSFVELLDFALSTIYAICKAM